MLSVFAVHVSPASAETSTADHATQHTAHQYQHQHNAANQLSEHSHNAGEGHSTESSSRAEAGVATTFAASATHTTTLSLHGSSSQAARVELGSGSSGVYSIEVTPKGIFQINLDQQSMLQINQNGQMIVNAHNLTTKGLSVSGFFVRGVEQWSMVAQEIFTPSQSTGWSPDVHFNCGAITLLGKTIPSGLDDNIGQVPYVNYTKTFDMPNAHSKVRIVATVHFLDDWQSETAYLKIDGNYVWTQSHSETNSDSKLNVCGQSYPDSKFSVGIDVTIPHTANTLNAVFGSNLASTDAMFAVSAFALYTKV